MAKLTTLNCAPRHDYWAAVTDVPCPCGGTIRWAEAGYAQGWRECDSCGRQFQAAGDASVPTLEQRRGPTRHGSARRRAQAAAEQAQRNEGHRQAVWNLLYATQNALPVEEHGVIYHEAGGHGYPGVTGDDLRKVEQAERAVQSITGGINIAPPERGIATRIALARKLRYPAAWAVWEELRAALPRQVSILVSFDAQTVRFICEWDCGSYEVARVRERLPQISALIPEITAQPIVGHQRVADLLA